MSVHPLIAAIANAKGFPAREIIKCRERQSEAISAFLPVLRQAVEDDLLLEWEEDEALFFIIHLLGEFGAQAAFPLMISFLRSEPEYVEDVIGDAVTATVSGVLIRIFDGDHGALESMIEDASLDEFLRAAVFDAWVYLVAENRIDRDHAHHFIRECATRLQPRDGCFIWSIWMNMVAFLGLRDLHDDVRRACEDGRVNPSDSNYVEFERLVSEVEGAADLTGLLEKHAIRPFTDTIAEFSKWSGFSEKDKRERRREEIAAAMVRTVTNPNRDVGRNDPCPCGSGKKFKKCCGG
jgi:hypothetical protein